MHKNLGGSKKQPLAAPYNPHAHGIQATWQVLFFHSIVLIVYLEDVWSTTGSEGKATRPGGPSLGSKILRFPTAGRHGHKPG